jgi:cytochrome c-type biogenesis protein CcmF
VIALWLAFWVTFATLVQVSQRLRTAPQAGYGAKVRAQPLAWWGMTAAHLGVAIFIFGVTLVRTYETERDLRMSPGQAVTIGGYEFTFKGTSEEPGPNSAAIRGDFEVRHEGSKNVDRTMHPEKRVYHASGQTMTEADIDSGVLRDLYVSLGEPVGDGAWGVRIYHKPFIDWIWGGCFVMAIGGFLALSDRRYRARRIAEAPAGATQGARA